MNERQNQLFAPVKEHREEFLKTNPALVARAKALENFANESARRTKDLETWANQWSIATKALEGGVKQLAKQVSQEKHCANVHSGSIQVPGVFDTEFRDQFPVCNTE